MHWTVAADIASELAAKRWPDKTPKHLVQAGRKAMQMATASWSQLESHNSDWQHIVNYFKQSTDVLQEVCDFYHCFAADRMIIPFCSWIQWVP